MTSDAAITDFANDIFEAGLARDIDPADAMLSLGMVIITIIRGAFPEPHQVAAAHAFAAHILAQFPDHATTRH